jgi:uncharacterized protein
MNRLTGEASAYLRSAAHQPIHWYPWGPEALQAARDQDRPILLDIGAVWCHWCHVMDGESYDDPSLAALINDRFIPVKVDRDERPDVDARYQKAVGALTGQGGWPLTGFLLPDGRVFYGGTYFPPDDRHGRPSFRRVLAAVADAYRDRKDQVLQQADALAAHLEPTPPNGAAVPSEWTTAGLDQILQHMDPVQGGWGHAPKFPHPSALEALLAAHETRPDPRWSSALISTLDGMARGGIRDHVGGGFHRYSVDERWHVPHFEKMLYDNAELLRDYAHAFRVLGRPRFRDVALDTMRFLQETLSDQQRGGFYGSQDADVSFGDDGDYFTWTKQELRDAVGEERLARLLELRYGVEARGPMHHDPAKNVLHEAADLEALAEAQGRPLAAVRADLAQGLDLLRKARAARKAPFVDPVLYTNWNGMAIRACLEAGPILGRPDAAAFALRTLDRFLAEAYTPERGFQHTLGGRAVVGLLDDQAQMLVALVAAFNHTQESRFLERAREVADLILRDYAAPGLPGLADTAHWRPIQDSPSPSANARALEGLLQLSDATGDERYRAAAREILKGLAPEAHALGLFGAALLLVARRLEQPTAKVVVAGPDGDAGVQRLHQAALERLPLGATVLLVQDGADGLLPEAQAFARGPAQERAGALVCVGTRCLAPVFEPEGLARALASSATPP